jgi:MGT family glycosyltransferase
MATYALLNAPTWGHVNPTLAVTQELVRRGHQVYYYITEEFRATIETTGAHFEPYEEAKHLGQQVNRYVNLQNRREVPATVFERVRAQAPDIIIYDFFALWGQTLIESLHIPGIMLRSTFASNEYYKSLDHMPGIESWKELVLASLQGPDEEKAASLKKMSSVFTAFGQFNIIFIPRFLQPMEETFDGRFVFVGPSLLPRHQEYAFPFEQLRDDLPLLYISLGTVINNQPDFYQHCFEAFGDQPWQVVLSIGKTIDVTQLGSVPDNFLLSPYVPQLEILPRAQIFVTHGGANSVMEGLYYGIPMIIIPEGPERKMNAERIVDHGLGIQLDKNTLTATTLRNAVEHIAQNPSYHEQAQVLSRATREAGGYERAVDAISQYTQKQYSG